jgi:NADH-quinone oxidoreductase subunit M
MPSEIFWDNQISFPILGALQLLPIAAIVILYTLRRSNYTGILAYGFASLMLCTTSLLYLTFDTTQAGLQFAERLPALYYHAAADGMSVLFLLTSSLISLMMLIYGSIRKLSPHYEFSIFVFAIESIFMGIFSTQNLLWFVILSAFEMLLIGYMLWRWAFSTLEDIAMRRYIQFMVTGIVLLLIGSLILGWNHNDIHGFWSFELEHLVNTPVPARIQAAIFFLLFYGLAVRIPLFPMHGWLPIMAEHGTVAISGVFLLGIKTGVFGLLRFVFPVLPEQVMAWQNFIVILATIGIFHAAVLAITQTNLRRLLAFAVVSHSSILAIGLFTLDQSAFEGVILLSINFGLAISILLFAIGMIYRRTRTLYLPKLEGLFEHIPMIGIAFLIASFSIVGMPGTPGFDAAHLIFESSIEKFGALVTIFAAFGNVIAAGFLLWTFQSTFLSPLKNNIDKEIETTTRSETILMGSLILVLIVAGFYSEPWIQLIEVSMHEMSSHFSTH